MNWTAVVPLGQQLAQRAPFLIITGLCAGIAPVSAPHLSKESEQGGREETTTWEWNPGITADSIHGHLVGIHIISLTMNTRRGKGEGDIDRLKPLKLTNHRSIRHHHRLALSFHSANTVSSLELSLMIGDLWATVEATSTTTVARALTWPAGIN